MPLSAKTNWQPWHHRLYRLLYFGGILALAPISQMIGLSGLSPWQRCLVTSYDIGLNFGAVELSILGWVLKLSLATSALGIFTRISYWLSFVSMSLLVLNALQFCHISNVLAPLPLSLLTWILFDRGPSHYLIGSQRIHLASIYFMAGAAKLKNSGFEWLNPESFRNIVIGQNFLFENAWRADWFQDVNHLVASTPWLCAVFAPLVLFLEISAPIALFSRRFAYISVPGLLMMQIGILTVMYIDFTSWAPLYLCWIPWARLTDGPIRSTMESWQNDPSKIKNGESSSLKT